MEEFELPIELGGSPFDRITVDKLDVGRLDGWRLSGHYWHVGVYVQVRDGSADDTPFSVPNPFDPRDTFNGEISWDLSSVEVGLAIPVAYVGYADVVHVSLVLGGGYYRMTVEPSGPTDFGFVQPGPVPPPPPIPGRITYEDETFTGLFATAGLHVRASIWRGLHVDLVAEILSRMGDVEATYLHLAFGASWDF